MILLDTDHATHLRFPGERQGAGLLARLLALPATETPAVPIVAVEEQMRGWLAVVSRERQFLRQAFGYRELQRLFEYYQDFEVVAFDAAAAERGEALRQMHRRLGATDLKIAATALVHDATLLSANLRDFGRISGLKVENWLNA